MKKNVMTEEEFELACQDIIQKYSEQLDIRIKIDKECIDSHNQSIKKVRNYKSKLLTYLLTRNVRSVSAGRFKENIFRGKPKIWKILWITGKST